MRGGERDAAVLGAEGARSGDGGDRRGGVDATHRRRVADRAIRGAEDSGTGRAGVRARARGGAGQGEGDFEAVGDVARHAARHARHGEETTEED